MRVPEGDNRERAVCDDCGYIAYVNPKIVVGAVCEYEGRILICRRDIEPRRGFWTLPAGFLEEGETTEAGARREAREEALARITITALLGVYNVARISQVHLFYKARLEGGQCGVGEETAEVALVRYDEIPWEEIAFPSVEWALERYAEVRGTDRFAPFLFPEGDDRDAMRSPSDGDP